MYFLQGHKAWTMPAQEAAFGLPRFKYLHRSFEGLVFGLVLLRHRDSVSCSVAGWAVICRAAVFHVLGSEALNPLQIWQRIKHIGLVTGLALKTTVLYTEVSDKGL